MKFNFYEVNLLACFGFQDVGLDDAFLIFFIFL